MYVNNVTCHLSKSINQISTTLIKLVKNINAAKYHYNDYKTLVQQNPINVRCSASRYFLLTFYYAAQSFPDNDTVVCYVLSQNQNLSY